MSYKSLVTFISHQDDLGARLQCQIDLAARLDAHLEVVCLGLDLTQSASFYAGAPAIIYHDALDKARAQTDTLRAAAQDRLRNAAIRWSIDCAILSLGGINGYVGLKSRFADLVILPQPYGDGRGPQDEAILEAALFDGSVPVLVLPPDGARLDSFGRIVLAWDQSEEALHATRAALPLLRAADLVNIVVIDPPVHGPERSDPGGLLAQMLVRHGVTADVSVLARTLPATSDVLRRHVADKSADLLVMGAYSHSRLRQAILGGTTRNMLSGLSIPLFMAH